MERRDRGNEEKKEEYMLERKGGGGRNREGRYRGIIGKRDRQEDGDRKDSKGKIKR